MLVWQGANYLAPLLTFPHLARTLQPAGFGQLGLYLLIGGWMTIVSDWGTNLTGAKEIAQSNARVGEIDEPFWNIFVLRLAIAGVLLAGVILFLLLTRANGAEWLLLLAAWSMIMGNALTVSWCLQGLERLDSFAMAALVGRLFTVPATLFFVRHEGQAWVAVTIQGAGSIVIGLMSIYLLSRTGRIRQWRWSASGSRAHFIDGFPVFVSVFSHGLYSSTSTAMLSWLHGKAVTGIFVCADRLRLALQGLVTPISQAIFPRVSRLAATDRRAAIKTIRMTVLVLGGGMGVMCLILATFAPLIVRLVAGPSFAPSATVLRILAPTIFLVAINNIIGYQTLVPFGKQKTFARITGATALVNVAIVPVLVYFGAAIGAAAGVLATEAFMLLCNIVSIVRNQTLALCRP
jgi:O-antigen/teichoic acid export membrane protein